MSSPTDNEFYFSSVILEKSRGMKHSLSLCSRKQLTTKKPPFSPWFRWDSYTHTCLIHLSQGQTQHLQISFHCPINDHRNSLLQWSIRTKCLITKLVKHISFLQIPKLDQAQPEQHLDTSKNKLVPGNKNLFSILQSGHLHITSPHMTSVLLTPVCKKYLSASLLRHLQILWSKYSASMDMSLSKFQEMVKDREAWHAAVHGVTKSRTWLSDWTATTILPTIITPPASCPPLPPSEPALTGRQAGLAPLPGPDGRAGCPEEAGRGGLGRPAGSQRCRTSARPPTARGRARSRTWPSSGSRGIRPDARSGWRTVGEQT